MSNLNYNAIFEAVVAKLGSMSTIDHVYRYLPANPEGFPCAVVYPFDLESDYQSTGLDQVTLAFRILILYPAATDAEYDNARAVLGDSFSEVFNTFADRDSLGDDADFTLPVPSVWGVETSLEKPLLFAELNLQVRKFIVI